MAALMCLVPRARKTPYTKEYADFGPTIWDQLDKRFMSKRTLVWRSLPWNYDPAPAATEMLLPAQLHVCAPPDYPLHLFPQLYGYDPGQHLEQQRIYTVIDERDVAKLLEERIVGWLERTVRLTGMRAQPRSFIVLRQRQYDLEDLSPGAVKVSGMRPAVPHFVFAYGDAETWRDGVVMILQTEPPACFENSNWDFPGDLEQAVAREATTLAVQYKTRHIVFCDATSFVIVKWSKKATPGQDRIRRVMVLNIYHHSRRIRRSFLKMICEALDDKAGHVQWF